MTSFLLLMLDQIEIQQHQNNSLKVHISLRECAIERNEYQEVLALLYKFEMTHLSEI